MEAKGPMRAKDSPVRCIRFFHIANLMPLLTELEDSWGRAYYRHGAPPELAHFPHYSFR